MQIKTLMAATAAVSLMAFSAQAQVPEAQSDTIVNPAATLSLTQGASRDASMKSRSAIAATGQYARGLGDATKVVEVAGGAPEGPVYDGSVKASEVAVKADAGVTPQDTSATVSGSGSVATGND